MYFCGAPGAYEHERWLGPCRPRCLNLESPTVRGQYLKYKWSPGCKWGLHGLVSSSATIWYHMRCIFVKRWVSTNTNLEFRMFPRWEKNRDIKKYTGIYSCIYIMYMYPSTRMLAHSRAPHIFSRTYPSDRACSPPPGKVHRTLVQLRLPLFPISLVQQYSCAAGVDAYSYVHTRTLQL